MPELPEVQTIAEQIKITLPLEIKEFWLSPLTTRILKTKDFDPTGHTIKNITRTAKWLVFELEPFGFFLSNLGMSGTWIRSNKRINENHTHIIIHDPNKTGLNTLSYVDPRRFGHFYILNDLNFNNKMLSMPKDVSDESFDENVIAELFFKYPNKQLKPFLLDQSAFPGVGNYMASEICARSGILPSRLTGDISAEEILKIKLAIHTVINGAVETKGTTFSGGYRDADGNKGEGVKHLVVFYQAHCQMCLENGILTPVIKTIMSTRGTYHCPRCQK